MPKQINGFTLANSGAASVTMFAGTAADSSNSVLIQNTGPCNVNLSTGNGEGHLDTGMIATDTTYFFFAIAQAGGGAPQCIASQSPTPTLLNTTAGVYDTTPTVSALSGDNFLYNVSTVAGIRPGDQLDPMSGFVASGAQVYRIGTITIPTMGGTYCFSGCDYSKIVIPNSTDYNNLRDGMSISDGPVSYSPNCTGVAQGQIQNNTTITKIPGFYANTIQLSVAATGQVTNDCLTVSGGNVIYLNSGYTATASGSGAQRVLTGVSRMVAALYTYTNLSATNIIPFTQDGDTFYLQTPAEDITHQSLI